jgi:hypothetical protein
MSCKSAIARALSRHEFISDGGTSTELAASVLRTPGTGLPAGYAGSTNPAGGSRDLAGLATPDVRA